MKRRKFLISLGGSLLAIPAVIAVSGCGGGDDDDDDDDNAGVDAGNSVTTFEGATSSSDISGHSHSFTVQCADLTKSTATYSATGSGHEHSITLTGTQLTALAGGETVTLSTTDGHAHEWEARKPSNAC